MKVEILHIDECPSWVEAGARTRRALDALGLEGIEVEYALIRTEEDAAALPFAGSPTIVVDGEDLFPSDGRTTDLACRVYVTETGLAGLPSQTQLDAALAARR
ncbi:hypothetical protein [Microbacterium candidum]|uniref:Thioredoxin family protein n=1 Tax=Microbacterium candidum TaxID=3041922 RepID=A0ABT7N485_9MICO|nr:hypothetical protein [Microbacterium sp. ASV49]MDL9981517.1 hypothetical protein [Microbacterium sp. ASV49]